MLTAVRQHPHTDKKFRITNRITCKSNYVVYLLKCPCGLGYVGKTKQELKTRISEHKCSIRNRDEKSPVARHINSVGHDVCTLKFKRTDMIQPLRRGGKRNKLLPQREAKWIHNLQTESPRGLNEELLLSCFLWLVPVKLSFIQGWDLLLSFLTIRLLCDVLSLFVGTSFLIHLYSVSLYILQLLILEAPVFPFWM